MNKIFYIGLFILFIMAGCGENSSAPSETLKQPLNLSAQLQDQLVVLLQWDDTNDTETGYIIQRREESGNYSDIAVLDSDSEEYFDNDVTTNTTYYYRVAAVRDGYQSDWSNSAIMHTPEDAEAPSGLYIIELSTNQVILGWNDNRSGENGFIIQRKEGYGSFAYLDEVGSNVVQYTDQTVESITTYSYRIAAKIGTQYTGWSDIISITTPPDVDGFEFGEEGSFEIFTWNLKEFPINEETTVGYVVEIINQTDPDIIALQEIGSSYHFDLVLDQLEGWTGYKADGASYNIDLAYLFKADVISVESVYEIYEDDYYYFPRSPLVAEIEFDGVDIVVINNHLKASSGSENEARRRQACIMLEEYISTYHDYDNVIMLGDLNDSLIDEGYDNVFNSFLEYPEKYTFTDINIAEGNQSYWSYPSWPSHLDHILITNELFDEFEADGSDIQTIRVDIYLDGGFDEYEYNVSDHRPVGLKIEF